MNPPPPSSTQAGGGPDPSSSSSRADSRPLSPHPPPHAQQHEQQHQQPQQQQLLQQQRPFPPSALRPPLPPPFKLSSIPLEKRIELWQNPDSADCIIIVPVPTREHEVPDVAFSPPPQSQQLAIKRKFAELEAAGRLGDPPGAPPGPSSAASAEAGPSSAVAGPSPSSLRQAPQAEVALPALPRRDPSNVIAAPAPAASGSAAASSSLPNQPPQPVDPTRPEVIHRERMTAEEGAAFGRKMRAQLSLFELDNERGPRWPKDENGKKYAPDGWREKHSARHGFDSSVQTTVGHYIENAKEGTFKRRVFRAHVRVLGTQCRLLQDLLTRMIGAEPGYRQGTANTSLRPCTTGTSSFAKSSTAHQPRYACHFTRPPGEPTNQNAEIERILFLPMPDPDSFPLLLHYLYHAEHDVFGASLERDNAMEIPRYRQLALASDPNYFNSGLFKRKERRRSRALVPPEVHARIPAELKMTCSWRGVIWNVEHLGVDKPLEKYLGSWYKTNIRQAQAQAQGEGDNRREGSADAGAGESGAKGRNRIEDLTEAESSSPAVGGGGSRKGKGTSTSTSAAEKEGIIDARSASVASPASTSGKPSLRRTGSLEETSTMYR
ncbi:unnamed protein product, partial [Tilletia controversa]